ncbi:tyrosine-type recombinase/integrase [Salmonella enterica]
MKVRRDGRKPGPLVPDRLTLAFPTVRDSTGLKFGPNPPSFHEIRSLAGHLYESERGGDFAQRLLSHKNTTMTKNIWTRAVLSMLWFRQVMEYSSNFRGCRVNT